MKKILLILLLIVTLTSCGFTKKTEKTWVNAPVVVKVEKPSDALLANQKAIINKMDSYFHYTKQGVSKWDISLNISSEEWKIDWKANYDVKFDQDKKWFDSKIKWDFSVDVKVPQVLKFKWDFDLNLLSLDKKIFWKINSFNVNTDDKNIQMQVAMAKWFISPYIWKWVFSELPEDNTKKIDNKEFFTNKNKVVKILKKYPIFKSEKENENKDFYDYNIVIDEENVVKIIKEINKEVKTWDNKELTQEDIEKIKNNIKKAQLKWNIKIDKKDARYFVLTLEEKDSDSKVSIENTKDVLKINFQDNKKNTLITFDGKKDWEKISWKINAKEAWKDILVGDISFLKDKENFSFEWKFTSTQNKKADVVIKINDNTKEQSVSIKAPEKAQDIKEIMKSMWTWNPAMWTWAMNSVDSAWNPIK